MLTGIALIYSNLSTIKSWLAIFNLRCSRKLKRLSPVKKLRRKCWRRRQQICLQVMRCRCRLPRAELTDYIKSKLKCLELIAHCLRFWVETGKCIDGEYANYQRCKLLGYHLLMLIISISSRAEEQEIFTDRAKEGTILMPRTFQQLSQSRSRFCTEYTHSSTLVRLSLYFFLILDQIFLTESA